MNINVVLEDIYFGTDSEEENEVNTDMNTSITCPHSEKNFKSATDTCDSLANHADSLNVKKFLAPFGKSRHTWSVQKLFDHFSRFKFCILCHTDSNDEMQGGILHRAEESFYVHYYCLLFSCNLMQSSDENCGVQGFLSKDIVREWNRGMKHLCTFCKQKGATIGCAVDTCKVKFHFPCGLNNDVFYSFCRMNSDNVDQIGDYRAYCKYDIPAHANQASSRRSSRLSFTMTILSECCLCYEAVPSRASRDVIRTECCPSGSANGHATCRWFHRDCMKRLALSCGFSHLCCPVCRDVDNFRRTVINSGIYVPERDAAWELEPNAYFEHYREMKCQAIECVCPQNRSYVNEDSEDWDIYFCHDCGHGGSHLKCAGITSVHINNDCWQYYCSDCQNSGMYCMEKQCVCPLGKRLNDTSNNEDTRWTLFTCAKCSHTVHRACARHRTLCTSCSTTTGASCSEEHNRRTPTWSQREAFSHSLQPVPMLSTYTAKRRSPQKHWTLQRFDVPEVDRLNDQSAKICFETPHGATKAQKKLVERVYERGRTAQASIVCAATGVEQLIDEDIIEIQHEVKHKAQEIIIDVDDDDDDDVVILPMSTSVPRNMAMKSGVPVSTMINAQGLADNDTVPKKARKSIQLLST